MSELIDREELINRIASMENIARSDKQKALVGRAIYIAEHMPTVDSVVHGHWIPFHSTAAGDIQYCSQCEIGNADKTDYCPHCGADMREYQKGLNAKDIQ